MSWAYLEDASGFRGEAEKLLVPSSETELIEIVREGAASATPLTMAGSGSGLTGGRCPLGGWQISMEKFQKLEVGDGIAVVGAGVRLEDLHAAAKAAGQFYPPDPTETLASIGGTIACNASGSRSFKYGATRRWIESLRVVLADGSVLDVKRGDKIPFDVPVVPQPGARKHSCGYPLAPGMDWIDLFVGSEGTLGLVVEATVRLLPWPKGLLTGVVFFAEEKQAFDAMDAWRPVADVRMMEYMDHASLRMIAAKYPEIPGDKCALLIEQIVNSDADVDSWLDRLRAQHADAEISWFGTTDADRERFRKLRHVLPETALAITERNGFMKLGSDFAVPIPKAWEMQCWYRETLAREYPGQFVIFGHLGDAHPHVNMLPATQEEFDAGSRLMYTFAKKAVEMGGTVAAEHGLGKRKTGFLPIMYDEDSINAMKAVKRRLDPQWLLGRGNLFGWPVD